MTTINPANEPSTDEENLGKDKASFLVLLERLGDVTAASAELGINRGAGYRWARSVGIRGPKPHPGREMFRELRAAGTPRREAAAVAGVDIRTAVDWDKGIRKSNNRRIYPDGRVIEYTGNVNRTPTAKAIEIAALEKPINARYLSLVDREMIRDLHVAGGSLRTIATLMSRSPSTISREISRNRHPEHGEYQPYSAHRLAVSRRPRPKDLKIHSEVQLREYVAKKLGVRWSPEQISQALIREYPTTDTMRASPETIYQALYSPARSGLRRDLTAKLRTGRSRRKPRRSSETRRSRFVDPMTMICDRPPEVEDRSVPGHWEGDLITGAHNRSAIATLVERTTRFVILVHLPIDHTAESVRDGLVAAMNTLPAHLRGSLTWDQGVEMAHHSAIRLGTNMDVYFCDAASPWQRGSNENTNGLLRQYFPKGTNLSTYTADDLRTAAHELNERPRKTLDWDTPAERFAKLLITE